MEGRGLTLRSKSRRRPQISAPKPISGPLPANSKASGAGLPSTPRERPQQSSGATSDLVKRRYSTRFNQPPDLDPNAPPVPSLPDPKTYGGAGASPPGGKPSTGSSQPPRVDLKALRDPSLPVEKCECGPAMTWWSPSNAGVQMSPACLPMPPKRRFKTTRRVYGK